MISGQTYKAGAASVLHSLTHSLTHSRSNFLKTLPASWTAPHPATFLLAIAFLFAGLTSPAQSEVFNTLNSSLSINSKEWYKQAYEALAYEILVLQELKGVFATPNAFITRGEATALVVLVARVPVLAPASYATQLFNDVPNTHPLFSFIHAARLSGIVSGDSTTNTFRPDDYVSRAEALKIVLNGFRIATGSSPNPGFSDVASSLWSYPYIAAGKQLGIINGYSDGTSSVFKPDNSVNYAELNSRP